MHAKKKKIPIFKSLNYFAVFMFLVQTLIWEYLVILKCSCDVLEVSLAGTLPDFCVRGIIWLLIHLCRDHN